MTEDATRYFLIIATSHIVVELTLNLGRVSVAVSSHFGPQPITPYIRLSLGNYPTSSSLVSPGAPLLNVATLVYAFFLTSISGNVV